MADLFLLNVEAQREHLRSTTPHLKGRETVRYQAHGYPQIDNVAVCGRQIAVTLVTSRLDKVRCPGCRQIVAYYATPTTTPPPSRRAREER